MDNNWNPEGNTDNLKSQQGGPYNGQPYQPQQGQQGWTPQQQPYNPYAQQQPQFNQNPPQQQPYLNPNPPQYQPYQQPVQQTPKTVPPKKSKLPIIITIIAVLVIGLGVGIVVMTVIMLLWNYLITPLYMGYPRDAVAAINRELPIYKRIKRVVVRDTPFPRTSSGKIRLPVAPPPVAKPRGSSRHAIPLPPVPRGWWLALALLGVVALALVVIAVCFIVYLGSE